MEREDFRQGGGPCPVWEGKVEPHTMSMLRYVETLQDDIDDYERATTEARDLLDVGCASEARQLLNEVLNDISASTSSEGSEGEEGDAVEG